MKAADVRRRRFPALTAFLRGYLHEDFAVEHASAVDAARAFVDDASPAELEVVRVEWRAFAAATRSLPVEEVALLLTQRLGGGWLPRSRAELDEIGAALGTLPSGV